MLGYLNEVEEKAVNELKEKLMQALGSKLKHMILYGSKARGDYNEDSDIDLLVVVDDLDLETDDVISEIANDIELEYELIISAHTRSAKHYQEQLNNRINLFMDNVRKEGIAV